MAEKLTYRENGLPNIDVIGNWIADTIADLRRNKNIMLRVFNKFCGQSIGVNRAQDDNSFQVFVTERRISARDLREQDFGNIENDLFGMVTRGMLIHHIEMIMLSVVGNGVGVMSFGPFKPTYMPGLITLCDKFIYKNGLVGMKIIELANAVIKDPDRFGRFIYQNNRFLHLDIEQQPSTDEYHIRYISALKFEL